MVFKLKYLKVHKPVFIGIAFWVLCAFSGFSQNKLQYLIDDEVKNEVNIVIHSLEEVKNLKWDKILNAFDENEKKEIKIIMINPVTKSEGELTIKGRLISLTHLREAVNKMAKRIFN